MKVHHVALSSIALLVFGCAAQARDTHAASATSTTKTSAGAVSVPAPTVVGRLAEFDVYDSFDLDRVEKALTRAEPAMIVHVRARARARAGDRGEDARWAPAPSRESAHALEEGSAETASFEVGCPRGRPLSRYGATLTVRAGVGKIRLDVVPCGRPRGPTLPGVVWNVEGDSAVFVTFDGGRYLVDPALLVAGMPSPTSIDEHAPAAARTESDAVMSEADIRALTERGAMRGLWASELAVAGAAWLRCSAPLWDQALQEYEANDSRIVDTATKDRRSREITMTYSGVVEEVCAGERSRYERAMAGALANRELARRRLYEVVTARLGTRATSR